jgi:ATP-binding cassette subfamily B protein
MKEPKAVSHTHTIRKVLHYIRKYEIQVLLSLILAAVTTLLSLYIPILTGNGVDLIVEAGKVDFTGLSPILWKIVIAALLAAVGQWVMSVCNNYITYHVIKDVREAAFAKLQQLPLKYLDGHSTGDIVSRIVADVENFGDGLLMGFTQLFTGVITIVGTLYFMFITNVPITFVVVCITPISLLVARFIAKKTYSMFKSQSEIRGEQTALTEEILGNLKVIKAFSQEEKVSSRFQEINHRLSLASLRAVFFSSLTNPATRFVNGLVYAGVGVFGAMAAISGGISVGRLSCFLTYANQYTKPFNEISGVITELQNALACAARIFALIEEKPQVPEPKDAIVLQDVKGKVELEDVSFRYVPERELISHFHLQVTPGKRVAIVGPTGCGKTTLINLLMRFYDVDQGSIKIDDKDIRQLTRGSLRTNFGMVLQDTWIRQGNIWQNIAMGKADASQEEIIAAAKAAHAHSFIRRLPQGYDTVLTEEGGSLSQGQKQLLCIARVMLCLPPMLILDEATSSIDTRTEKAIQDAFAGMMQGRTSFIVAHRLSTIQEADVILVMRDGNVIEQGKHQELLAKKGFYAMLYESQFSQGTL